MKIHKYIPNKTTIRFKSKSNKDFYDKNNIQKNNITVINQDFEQNAKKLIQKAIAGGLTATLSWLLFKIIIYKIK